MAHIYRDKAGSYVAQIRRKGHRNLSRSFDTRREAQEWARAVESGLDRSASPADDRLTVADLVRQYRLLRLESGRPVEATGNEHYMLRHLEEDLGGERVAELTPRRMLAWATARRKQGAGGYTISMELSKLGTAIRHVASYLSITLPDVVGSARPLLSGMQVTHGPRGRARRVQEDELNRLIEYFSGRPVIQDAIRVSVLTGLRRGELVKIVRADVLDEEKAVIVRKRKHPRRAEAADHIVPLLGESYAIVKKRLGNDKDRAFPIEGGYLSKQFAKACNVLGIDGLRWHDLRHEASSRLRDLGFEAVERQAILGHTTERMNARYTHVTVEALHSKHRATSLSRGSSSP